MCSVVVCVSDRAVSCERTIAQVTCVLRPKVTRSTFSMSKRRVVRSEGREIIARVFHFLQEEYKFMKANNIDRCDLSPLANVLKRTARATGVGKSTVTRILKEEKNLSSSSDKFTSPMRKRRKRESKFQLDDMKREIIRTTIENFHSEHKVRPSLAKIQSVLKEKIGFDGCLNTLRTLLIELGYTWKKQWVINEEESIGSDIEDFDSDSDSDTFDEED